MWEVPLEPFAVEGTPWGIDMLDVEDVEELGQEAKPEDSKEKRIRELERTVYVPMVPFFLAAALQASSAVLARKIPITPKASCGAGAGGMPAALHSCGVRYFVTTR